MGKVQSNDNKSSSAKNTKSRKKSKVDVRGYFGSHGKKDASKK